MSDLQGIVVLCSKVLIVIALLGGGYYLATVTNDGTAEEERIPETLRQKDRIVECTPEQRNVACIQIYQPVCALVDIVCITTLCNPVEETFSNSCVACSNSSVQSYIEGECTVE